VRLLTNLETAKHKLLQMVLLGQPELRQLLQGQNLRQLAQRITARYHLTPLNEAETFAYIKHRMRVAGAHRSHFSNGALKAIFQRSGGVPRLINIIADRALSGAYAQEKDQVSAALVHAAANEVQPNEHRLVRRNGLSLALAAGALVAVAGLFLAWQQNWLGSKPLVGNAVAAKAATDKPDTANLPAEALPVALPPIRSAGLEPEPAAGSREVPSTEATLKPALTSESGVGALVTGSAGALALRDPQWTYQNALDSQPLRVEWLADQHLLAYPALAQLWQEPNQAKALLLACEGVAANAEVNGFACMTENGSWAKVKMLGLPVILVLNADGEKHVLLRGISGQRILLGAGSDPQWFRRDKVDELWMGKYIVAWPQSPDWPDQIRRGDSSAAVEIVLSMAALAEPPWQGEVQGPFDLQFENWLKSFQASHGLLADGIVGPQTLLYLMAPGISEPRLELENREGS